MTLFLPLFSKERDVLVLEKDNPKKPYGNVSYADPGYQSDGKKRYPIDTEAHIRAAWNYINKEHNQAQYSAGQVKHIKSRIVAAWRRTIDSSGPPSAGDKEKTKKSWDFGTIVEFRSGGWN